ncbi:MAG: hypothetical protein O3C43_17905 [Verrucomicrobia bacterium]|nr:hypothetical protein [Verrucomicrobiota bacterium]MDA1068366.1 hypothetical protein [Verrucomicrobiota bacterium]
MEIKTTNSLCAILSAAWLAFATQVFPADSPFLVKTVKDNVTGRTVQWYQSSQHENHYYYCVNPWDQSEEHLTFFQFDKSVTQMDASHAFPGSLWIMNSDGSGRRMLADGLFGHSHTGIQQNWGYGGKTVIFSDNSDGRRGIGLINVETGSREFIETSYSSARVSPDFTKLSCVGSKEWGIMDMQTREFTQLVSLERVLALSPNKQLAKNKPSHLQNTRFSPDGKKCMLVHRTSETYPTLVEVYVYDFNTGGLSFIASDLHHPTWRPDGKVILFVRREPHTNTQTLWEVDVETTEERCVFTDHVPAGHPSYHPLKPHLVITDCFGGEFGYGIAVINLKTKEQKQLVTIPLGIEPPKLADPRFPFRNWHIWMPARKYLNEPRPVFNKDGTKVLYTSEESGRFNLYVVDTSDL